MSKAIEKLERIIEEQEEKISDLEETIEYHERCLNWMVHRIVKEEEVCKIYEGYDKLPLPRLEMQINPLKKNWYEVEYIYGIVYKHLDDTVLWVPIGRTVTNGVQDRFLKYPLNEIDVCDKFPYRDGLHIRTEMNLFNLKGFLLCNGQIEEINNNDGTYSDDTYKNAISSMNRVTPDNFVTVFGINPETITVRGKGTTSATKTNVIIEDCAGNHLLNILCSDDGINYEVFDYLKKRTVLKNQF